MPIAPARLAVYNNEEESVTWSSGNRNGILLEGGPRIARGRADIAFRRQPTAMAGPEGESGLTAKLPKQL